MTDHPTVVLLPAGTITITPAGGRGTDVIAIRVDPTNDHAQVLDDELHWRTLDPGERLALGR
jgi:hypothetical protein